MQKKQLEQLEYLITKSKKLGADEVDAIILDSTSYYTSYKNGELENNEYSQAQDVGLRVIIEKKQAMVSSSIISKKNFDEIAQKAVDMAKHTPKDPHCGLAKEDQLAKTFKELNNFDENTPSVKKLAQDAKEIEDAGLSVKGVTKSDGASTSFSKNFISCASSNGFSRSYKRTNASAQISLMAGSQDKNNMEVDYDFSNAVFYNDLKPNQEIGKKAGENVVKRLNPKKIKTSKMPVIYSPKVAKSLLSHFSSAINGVAIARKTSFLKDKLDKQIFSKYITITEDPFRHKGLRSRPVDIEGIAPRKRNIVENGVLNSFILDLHTSRQLGLNSTGNATRGTNTPPSPSITNLYINHGDIALSDMIKNIPNGFYITELIGQGVKLINGDYSKGAAGFLIENGEITSPVNEVTIAGNLKDMFLNITPAKELEFIYGIDSPALLIENMTVAGK